ncbi:unnamed protein product [Eretmochelys imbricata]
MTLQFLPPSPSRWRCEGTRSPCAASFKPAVSAFGCRPPTSLSNSRLGGFAVDQGVWAGATSPVGQRAVSQKNRALIGPCLYGWSGRGPGRGGRSDGKAPPRSAGARCVLPLFYWLPEPGRRAQGPLRESYVLREAYNT